MADQSRSTSPKDSDNTDKSLHGMAVGLAMAGIIAGSIAFYAYSASDSNAPAQISNTDNNSEFKPDAKLVLVEKNPDNNPVTSSDTGSSSNVRKENLEYANIATTTDEKQTIVGNSPNEQSSTHVSTINEYPNEIQDIASEQEAEEQNGIEGDQTYPHNRDVHDPSSFTNGNLESISSSLQKEKDGEPTSESDLVDKLVSKRIFSLLNDFLDYDKDQYKVHDVKEDDVDYEDDENHRNAIKEDRKSKHKNRD